MPKILSSLEHNIKVIWLQKNIKDYTEYTSFGFGYCVAVLIRVLLPLCTEYINAAAGDGNASCVLTMLLRGCAFLQARAREHQGKLDIKALLIKPVQRFPQYELLLKVSHPLCYTLKGWNIEIVTIINLSIVYIVLRGFSHWMFIVGIVISLSVF